MSPQPENVCDLSAALARMGGDAALLRQLARFFAEDAPVYLARLQDALAANDRAGVQHAAHSLKGLAANFDAQAAVLAALRVEEWASEGGLTPNPEAIRALEGEISRLQAALTAEFRGP